jgi:hypothetical protein
VLEHFSKVEIYESTVYDFVKINTVEKKRSVYEGFQKINIFITNLVLTNRTTKQTPQVVDNRSFK